MGALAPVALLADAADQIRNFVDVFIAVYIILILAYILSSWFRLPYLRIFRRFVPALGPLDLSPMVAVLALLVLQRVLHAVIDQI
jgi:YggT family protein